MSARQPWAAGLIDIQLRAASADDREAVARFLAAMDGEGLYQRHFAHGDAPNLALLSRVAAVDQRDRVVVLAVDGHGEVIAHAEYVAADARAEFALMVLPRFRALGIGRRLLQALQGIASAAGQRELHGIIQASNTGALKLTLNSGFRVIPGGDATSVIVSRQLPSADFADAEWAGADRHPIPDFHHDPDRTPLHRRLVQGTPFRARGGQVQRLAADAVGGGQEA
ncbi:MAG: GNAT family N-acetyltransferase [Sulfuritalea sp.]|nr:GNAT family N-acetyltransferase [Sulfuritalea sp.]